MRKVSGEGIIEGRSNQYKLFKDTLLLYTHGACDDNDGSKLAGSGVYNGCNNNCYVGAVQGAQNAYRAELNAILFALETIEQSIVSKSYSKAIIFTQSQICIDAISSWALRWMRNEANEKDEAVTETTGPWRKNDGNVVLNQDLYIPIMKLYVKYKKCTSLFLLKEDNVDPGKFNAEKLAVHAIHHEDSVVHDVKKISKKSAGKKPRTLPSKPRILKPFKQPKNQSVLNFNDNNKEVTK